MHRIYGRLDGNMYGPKLQWTGLLTGRSWFGRASGARLNRDKCNLMDVRTVDGG